MLVVVLPIAVALVAACAYLVVSMAPPATRVGRWLALWIAAWAEVVLTVEILSLLEAVTPLGFLVCYVAFGAVAVIVWLTRGRPRVRLLTLPRREPAQPLPAAGRKSKKRRAKVVETSARGPVRGAFLAHPALGVLLALVALCALVNLLLAVGLPVNNYDANTYHLSRVGYWIQHGSTDHYFTHNERQNFMPPNAEYGILSLIIFARAEWPSPLAQYAAYFVCLAAVYAIARELGASNAASLFAALLLGTMTEVVLQATVPKNDLVVSSFLASAFAFAIVGLGPGRTTAAGRTRALVWSGLALGLAFGTKTTTLLFLPGLAVAGVAIALSAGVRAGIRRLALWAACCAGAIVPLGSLNGVRNWASYGSFLAPPSFSRSTRIARPSVRSVASNLARYGYHLCDFSGLWPRPIAHALTRAKARAAPGMFNALRIVANAPDLNLGSAKGAFPVDAETGEFDRVPHLHEDSAWFGPIGFFVVLPLVLVLLVSAPTRGRWPWFAVALTPAMYWLVQCILLRYSIWNGRYFITAAVVGAPVLALAYSPWADRRTTARLLGATLTWLLVIVGTSTALTATLFNAAKPVIPRLAREEGTDPSHEARAAGVLTLPRVLLRCRYSESTAALLAAPPKFLPEDTTLGLVTGSDDWDWPFFGPHLRRRLVPLPLDAKRVTEAFESGEVDMVAILRSAAPLSKMDPILGERPLFVQEGEARNLMNAALFYLLARDWRFLLRDEGVANLLFPTRDWICIEDGAWVRAHQFFAPTRQLGPGKIVFCFQPNEELVRRGPLIFQFGGQKKTLRQVEIRSAELQQVVLDWNPGTTTVDQVLLVQVTSTNPEADNAIQGADKYLRDRVYRLPRPPAFQPAQPAPDVR